MFLLDEKGYLKAFDFTPLVEQLDQIDTKKEKGRHASQKRKHLEPPEITVTAD